MSIMTTLTVVYLFSQHNRPKRKFNGTSFQSAEEYIVVAKPLVKAIKFNKQFNEITHPCQGRERGEIRLLDAVLGIVRHPLLTTTVKDEYGTLVISGRRLLFHSSDNYIILIHTQQFQKELGQRAHNDHESVCIGSIKGE